MHQYVIDWDVLSDGGDGVIVSIDDDGDGVFERTITADSELTLAEFDTEAPTITCPADVTLECPADTSIEGTGRATATDNYDDAPDITYADSVRGDCSQVIERTWTATDAAGNSSTCVQVITVVDTTAPVVSSIAADPSVLWAANHKMVGVTVSVLAGDACNESVVCRIIDVTANEPINGTGDGNTEPDWEITGDLTVNLRARRSGGYIRFTLNVWMCAVIRRSQP